MAEQASGTSTEATAITDAFAAARGLLAAAEADAARMRDEVQRYVRQREQEAELLVAKARRLLAVAEGEAASIVATTRRQQAQVVDLDAAAVAAQDEVIVVVDDLAPRRSKRDADAGGRAEGAVAPGDGMSEAGDEPSRQPGGAHFERGARQREHRVPHPRPLEAGNESSRRSGAHFRREPSERRTDEGAGVVPSAVRTEVRYDLGVLGGGVPRAPLARDRFDPDDFREVPHPSVAGATGEPRSEPSGLDGRLASAIAKAVGPLFPDEP